MNKHSLLTKSPKLFPELPHLKSLLESSNDQWSKATSTGSLPLHRLCDNGKWRWHRWHPLSDHAHQLSHINCFSFVTACMLAAHGGFSAGSQDLCSALGPQRHLAEATPVWTSLLQSTCLARLANGYQSTPGC